jgi:hypothetical protein
MRRLSVFIALFLLFLTTARTGQTVILWQVENNLSPTLVPAYRGQESPFPRPKVQASEPSLDDEAAQAAMKRQQALTAARALAKPNQALQLNNTALKVKGVSKGINGVRVLIDEEWVGLNQVIPVRYSVNVQTLAALRELQQWDEAAARVLESQIKQDKQRLEQEGVQITAVNVKNRQITLKTPQGVQQLPFYLEP